MSTPRDDGLSMPAEFAPHAATYMEWPTRVELWGDLFEQAKLDYAEVANAIAAFEPLVMVTDPDQADEARSFLTARVEILPIPIDDSWMRDNGPIFVTDGDGGIALVQFRFNSWGEKFLPYDRDADVPKHVAEHIGMRRYEAPMVLEGGSFFVDGEGTLFTTEQCLLNPNRNPSMTRQQIEETLRAYLGVDAVIWLGEGHSTDRDTDGHIDGVLQVVRPGLVMLLAPADPQDPDQEPGADNVRRLRAARDARGRAIEVIAFDPGVPNGLSYMNFYLCNGGAIVPVVGREEEDEPALGQIRAAFPDREVVVVPGWTIHEGGGGPHCITQQVPVGSPLP
ncbi:MAG TPA: agmatine deiminase family protein [Actinomycetota bacterium]|jgi:agmatine deiminase|nr:agmatine deiminase family protein [Actinomycetota bacterium]